jgi:hypothetical protein
MLTHFAAVNEMQIEPAHLAERQEVVIPLLRRGRGDRDLVRANLSGGD